ncbi:aryl-alcohol dehydrogenase-like predicted oxidoreductase [Rhodococcus sp. OK611]|uniref:aldo/keto reductase n=1 Tax=Rhodococcus TaxID=1827 RepID=UPI000BC37FFD|nr:MULTISPECIES: aldo/keto reductase [Rhodococcus]MCZ4558457.1 aldo/keto reductase [Rhodococcus maanshanensis]PTR45435.1 aryl-alcohol dehydrogenase-like predicted oxidoreductase [Rhodococcus sp. OK611]SNX88985.1 Predicted oxidoreductase [Rhodococcus sp. OK270]
MRQRAVGDSGLRVSRIGLGTLGWGRDTDGVEAAAQLMGFAESGGTLVDSAPFYGDGVSQRILAELLDDVVPRNQLVLSSSAGIHPGPERLNCSRRALIGQLDATLKELGTDHLDLWQVATWDPFTPVEEVASALEFAVATGRARYVGARGHLGWQLATAAAGTKLIATQAEYSLLARGVEDELIPAADHHGIGLLAAVPLAGGVLTGKYRDGIPADSRGATETGADLVVGYLNADHTARVVEAVVTAADGLGASPLAVALAWVCDRPGVASAIVGARDYAQHTGVLAAEDLELPAAIAAALDDVSA